MHIERQNLSLRACLVTPVLPGVLVIYWVKLVTRGARQLSSEACPNMDGTGGSIERWATESRLRKELLVVTQAVSKPTSSAISVLVAFSYTR